jgi:hypothetical protein
MNRVRVVAIVCAAVGLAAAVLVYVVYFAPQGTQRVDQASIGEVVAVKRGTFAGADAVHEVSGDVVWHPGGLRFSNYEATSGPDVFFYLSDGTAFEESKAVRVPVLGGHEGAQATLRGNFEVPLPAAADAGKHTQLVVWCKRFGVQFGSATLQ